MTINSPAAIIWAMYIAAAEKQGVRPDQTARHHPERYPEGIYCPERIYLPAGTFHAPGHRHNRIRHQMKCRNGTPISISGYHIREAGSTAAQELAFTLADGMEYVRWALTGGWILTILPRGFLFSSMPITISLKRSPNTVPLAGYGRAKCGRPLAQKTPLLVDALPHPNCWCLTDCPTAGNQYRPSCHPGPGSCLGGTQSLHTNSMDEALALPSEHAVTIALRTQQIIAEESGVTNTIDPAGWFLFP